MSKLERDLVTEPSFPQSTAAFESRLDKTIAQRLGSDALSVADSDEIRRPKSDKGI
jgi:hypothetical protein